MARYKDSRCKRCRREGMKLFLKGERCATAKCAYERRSYPPGEHGKERMPKPTGYAIHLREKQKVRSIYGILERQFRGYFEKASRMKGVTGDNLLALLERRLDNVVYRLGFAASRSAARQLIGHRHFTVNGRVVNIPSHIMRPGDEVRVRPKSKEMVPIKDSLEKSKGSERANWLELDAGSLTGRVVSIPTRESINLPINEQLIVELYSK